jgi:hypothetical protein
MLRRLMMFMIGAAVSVPASLPGSAEAGGPWRGRVVDAETLEPLDAVVVVGYWRRSAGGHPTLPFPVNVGPTGDWGSEEVITGADGRFALQARVLIDPGVTTHVSGPHLAVFRGGYGGWRFDPGVQWPSLLAAGVTIEMEPLHTLQERRRYASGMRELELGRRVAPSATRRPLWRDAGGPPRHLEAIPKKRRARYDEAIEWERALLGLPPRSVPPVPVQCTRITMAGCE